MDEKNITIEDLARDIEFNVKAEAEAIMYYADFLKRVDLSSLDLEDKEYIKANINEIMADELNHQNKLQKLFVTLTNVAPNKD